MEEEGLFFGGNSKEYLFLCGKEEGIAKHSYLKSLPKG
jgi:hypothetical protein